MPGNDGEVKPVEQSEKQKQEAAIANRELQAFESNDATSAFSVLAQAQEIEDKVEK